MKKISSAVLLLIAVLSSVIFSSTATYAACGSEFQVGANAERISACSGASESSQIPGFSVDLSSNKIMLNNYNGGAIYYFCRGTCADTKNMEIELIGNNTINSQSSSQHLQKNGVPQNAAFMNIIPNFTGSGTLKIDAAIPFAFEYPDSTSFSLEIIGKDFISTSTSTQTSKVADTEDTKEDSTSTIAEKDATEGSTSAAIETNGPSKSEPSFFDTTTGMILLISVPSILVIIIIALIIALTRKSKNPQLPEQNNLYTNLGQTN